MGSVVKSIGGALGIGGGGGKKPNVDTTNFNIRAESRVAKNLADKERRLAEQRGQAAQAGTSALISDLTAQAAGQGPSLAQAQLKSATNRNLAQQLAAAASSRGGNPAAQQRQLLQQQGAAGRDLAEQSAQARIQEQLNARQQLQSALQNETSATDALKQAYQQQGFNYAIAPKTALQQAEQIQFGAVNQRAQQSAANRNALIGGLVQGGATLGAAAVTKSDERAKKEIKPAAKEVNSFLKALNAREYEYKDASAPGAAPGKRYGIMAQDLEKSKMGKSLVKDTAHGKMIDTVQGFGAVLAAQAELNKRLEKLEKKG
jgi:hypothetical protein